MLLSVLPGRISARLPSGAGPQGFQALRAAIEGATSEVCLAYNPRSRGVLITWEPNPELDCIVHKAVEAQVESRCSRATNSKWPSMKTVKLGMAASLGVAMTALALRSKRGHMWAAGTFAAFLSRHLYVYRKRLFK